MSREVEGGNERGEEGVSPVSQGKWIQTHQMRHVSTKSSKKGSPLHYRQQSTTTKTKKKRKKNIYGRRAHTYNESGVLNGVQRSLCAPKTN